MRKPQGYELLHLKALGAAVAVSGPSDGLPVFVIHGFSNTPLFATRRTMTTLATACSAFGSPVRLFAPVLPGFGGTSPLSQRPTFDSYATWCAEVIRELNVRQPVIVIGESMGGAIALRLTAQHSELIAALALFNTVGVPTPDRKLADWVKGVVPACLPRRRHTAQWLLSLIDVLLLARHPLNAWRCFRMIANADLRESMKQVRDAGTPTVLTYGYRDTVIPPSHNALAATALGVEAAWIDADHRSFIDNDPAIALVLDELAEAVNKGRDVNRRKVSTNALRQPLPRIELHPQGPRVPGTPFVLGIHGFSLSGHSFDPLGNALSTWTRFAAPDLPGFGRSDKPTRVLNVDEHALVLAQSLDDAGETQVVLVGHSLGTQIASALAVKRPDLVAGCVLIGPTVEPNAASVTRQLIRATRDGFHEPPRYLVRAFYNYAQAGLRTLATSSRYAVEDNAQQRLASLKMPVIVVRGAEDKIASEAWARQVANALAQASFLEIPGAAHAAQWADRGAIAAAIKDVWGKAPV